MNKISFKHGYATTVCNPQTAVKKDVYVLHNNGVGIESSNISMIGMQSKYGCTTMCKLQKMLLT
ncbi:putative conjugative transfer protein TraI [Orientia tsutsugamushi str. UT76]|nr:putative conjugative transfer protein TraI [Orientia tsutsugamushi str. UT76]